MRIHYFQHVPFEGLGNIENWIKSQRHTFSETRLYENAELPTLADIDWLIVMGGPMGACDDDIYPWLIDEKRFIGQAINLGIKVLGICLGAQLIASVLGAKVYPNAHKEIGWFPLHLTADGAASSIFAGFPAEFTVFHWHGDTFDLPAGAKHLAASKGCVNQAFLYNKNVLGLQFHLDVTIDNIKDWVQNGADELVAAPYIQTAGEMLSPGKRFAVIEKYMGQVLDRFAQEER
jgi:GMP synthase-like glutamine amidotransferase